MKTALNIEYWGFFRNMVIYVEFTLYASVVFRRFEHIYKDKYSDFSALVDQSKASCKSDCPLFAKRITRNYAYTPFNGTGCPNKHGNSVTNSISSLL